MFTQDHMANRPIEAGDAGIILRANGAIQIFTTGGETVAETGVTPRQRKQVEQLAAGVLALTTPEIYDQLMAILAKRAAAGHQLVDLGAAQ